MLLGPDSDIPSPDVNTGSQTMAWIMDTLSMHRGHTVAASVIGKPMAIGGTRGRRSATARGALRCIAAAAKASDRDLAGARVVVQGFGRVGMTLAEELAAAGASIVGLGDDRDAVANPRGIDVQAAVRWMREHDAILDLPDAEPMTKAELFAMDCDVVALAGLQGEITDANADAVRAPLVAEVANGGTTPAADLILADRGRHRDSRHHLQLGWHRPRLLRVGAGHAGLLLERDGDHRPAGPDRGRGDGRGAGHGRRRSGSTCAGRR